MTGFITKVNFHVGGLHDYIPGRLSPPDAENCIFYHDHATRDPCIKIDKLIVYWFESSYDDSLKEDRWVRVDNRGARYVNHVIKQVAGLLERKRIDPEYAEITLDMLYAILESKL